MSCVRQTHHTHPHTHAHTHTNTHTHTHTTHSAFREFEESDDLGVAVLSGRGGNFCAGYDLKELAGTPVESILGDFGVGPAPMVSSESKYSYLNLYTCWRFTVSVVCAVHEVCDFNAQYTWLFLLTFIYI